MITYEVRVDVDGSKSWWLNDKLHREDGPAIEYASGSKFWWLNDKLHREDGPAIECADGYKAWYLNGKCLTEKEFIKRTSKTKELTVKEVSDMFGYEVKIIKE